MTKELKEKKEFLEEKNILQMEWSSTKIFFIWFLLLNSYKLVKRTTFELFLFLWR